MQSIFNVHNYNSVLATISSGPDNIGTVTTTNKTNSYSSYLVSLFNDIELDSFTIFTLSGDDVITRTRVKICKGIIVLCIKCDDVITR